MSRIIKFRAWDFQKHKMRIVDHISFLMNGEHLLWFYEKGKEKDPDFLFTNHEKYGKEVELMQFTGLTDKNGKEVYEGDIVKSLWQHDGVTCYDYTVEGIIEWEEDRLIYCIHYENKEGSGYYPLYSFEREESFPDDIEIIGNIFENPELTSSGKQ